MIYSKIHTTHYKATPTQLIAVEMLNNSIVYHRLLITYDVNGVESGYISDVDGFVIDNFKVINQLFDTRQHELAFNLIEAYVNINIPNI